MIEGNVSPQMNGFYAIDDIDIRDSYCGVSPIEASVTSLTTPQTATRPTTPATSRLIRSSFETHILLKCIVFSANNV